MAANGMRRPAPGSRKAGRLALALALGVTASATAASPVGAAEPVRYPFQESATEPIPCGGFDAILERNLTGTISEFANADGDVVRIQIATQMRGSLSAGALGSIDLTGNLVFVIDLVKQTFAFNGQVFQGTSQGAGVVIQDTGRFLLNSNDEILLLAGPHDAITNGAAAFCQAFG